MKKLGAILMFLFVMFSFIAVHEMTHKVIFKYYGIDSEIKVGPISKGALFSTKPNMTQIEELYKADRIGFWTMMEAQSITESIGYQIGMLQIIIIILFMSLNEYMKRCWNAIQEKRKSYIPQERW